MNAFLRSASVLIFGLLFCYQISAQISHGGTPYSWYNAAEVEAPEVVSMPAIDVATLLAEDALVTDKSEAFRFGYEFAVNFNLTNSGTWTTLANGDRIWRLRIDCKDAVSINLLYDQFWIPLGAKFHIYNSDKTDLLGAFIHANNKRHGKFATGLLEGGISILEYYEPFEVAGEGTISISSIVHGYRDYGEGYPTETNRDYTDSGSCNINVQCPLGSDWQEQSRSVAMILYSGFRLCTGAMINNAAFDCTPYFLTANHCYGSQTPQWMFMFNYESEGCANQDGPTDMSVVGCEVKARGSGTDFMLLELSMEPPSDYNVYYSGWSKRTSAASSATCIHHPAGDIKKISFNEEGLVSSGSYWRVNAWEEGTTEGGSSGSPIYNEDKLIVGQLYGGSASCQNFLGYDEYGKFNLSFDGNGTTGGSLSVWLDPAGTDSEDVLGMDCAVKALDMALSSIASPVGQSCGDEIAPAIIVENMGTETILSMNINYSIDGGPPIESIWEGSVEPGGNAIMSLESSNISIGTHSLEIDITNLNGMADQDANNDSVSLEFEVVAEPSFETCLLPASDSKPGRVTVNNVEAASEYVVNLDNVEIEGSSTEVQTDAFEVSIEDSFGCETEIDLQLSKGITTCASKSIDLSSAFCFGPDDSISWEFPGADEESSSEAYPSVRYSAVGNYDVILVLNGESRQYSSFVTVEEAFNFELRVEDTSNGEDNGVASVIVENESAYSISWSNSESSDYSLDGIAPGEYSVRLTNLETGCSSSKSFSISGEWLFNDEFGLYPNPASEEIFIFHSEDQELAVEIFDMAGRKLLKTIAAQGHYRLDISAIPAGVYIIKLDGKDYSKIRKFHVYK